VALLASIEDIDGKYRFVCCAVLAKT